ncbi:MAG: DUF2855 family protein [Gammaproteobacteria bacterium]|nr:DUF2855 family protein [Gammaproteobacteria bacterium]
MTQCTEVWVDRTNYRDTKVVELSLGEPADGEILVAIEKFGLTANNVSYAISGDAIGYWGYYPTGEEGWGKVPVWSIGRVVASNCVDVAVGERLWGFFPMASHVVLQPGKIAAEHFVDMAAHRQELPALYNGYRRTVAEPEMLTQMENERCLLFPLFITSFVLYDFLVDNEFFGAGQVLIGSASSKTGFGLAKMLHNDPEVSVKVVGLTSERNVAFLEKLGCCDQIVVYGNEHEEIDAHLPAAYVDMSGDVALTTTLHEHLGDNMKNSAMVGASHWQDRGPIGQLPGAKPTFFFAPGQIAKRDEEWGRGMAMAKAMQASVMVAQAIKDDVQVEWVKGAEALIQTWQQLLDNQVPPTRGLMVSLLDEA